MLTSFYSGLTGLSAYANALNVVGNNLANINTTGFKAMTIAFEDLVANTFGGLATNGAGNPMQVGLGIKINSVDGIFSQGSIQNTTEATNVALEGNGFFIVGATEDDRLYTRAGNFSFNREGYLINPAGKYVLGYTQRDADGNIIASGALDRINLPANTISAPAPSTMIQIFANLDPNDPITPAAGSTYTSSVTVYDSLGAPHTLNVVFTHTAALTWTYQMYLPGEEVVGGVPGTPYALPGAGASGTVVFDGTGTMTAPAANVLNIPTPAFTNGANALVFDWNVLDDNGVPTLTGYPIESTTISTNTDGFGPGTLTSLIVGNDGVIQGVFSNGQVEQLARLAVASFNNDRGLLRVGENAYLETNASGTAAIGAPGTGGRGLVTGSALESSNVDIASEFTSMMVFERGYQANSRIITTADEVIQTALNIKR